MSVFFRDFYLTRFWILNQPTVDNGGVSRGRFVAVGVSDKCEVIASATAKKKKKTKEKNI